MSEEALEGAGDNFQKLTDILKTFVRKGRSIAETTKVNADLYLSGDDAWELIEALDKQFGVDLRGFEFVRFFFTDEETFAPYFGSSALLEGKEPLPVSHLLAVIERKRWFNPGETPPEDPEPEPEPEPDAEPEE